MTLQTTGAISLSNIQTEFTGSNPISLSEYYSGSTYNVLGGTKGVNGEIPASGTIPMSAFYGSAHSYFLSLSSLQIEYLTGSDIYTSTGEIICAGYGGTAAGGSDGIVVKLSKEGTIIWQRKLGPTDSTVIIFKAVSVDQSTGDIYCMGDWQSGSFGYHLIAKYNSSGTLQWQRRRPVGDKGSFRQARFNTSTNLLYVTGLSSVNSRNWDLNLSVYNSSGTLQWSRQLSGLYWDGTEYGIVLDSSNNIYLAGYTDTNNSNNFNAVIAKYNSSGTLQWQRRITNPSGTCGFRCLAIDSASNLYAAGWNEYTSTGLQDAFVAKYNSSGTIQWQRLLGGTGTEDWLTIDIDSSDNITLLGITNTQGAGDYDLLNAKYDSSGTIQWQKYIGTSSSESSYPGVGLRINNADGFTYLSAKYTTTGGNVNGMFLKFPSLGCRVGTFGSGAQLFSCGFTTLTAKAGSSTDSAGTLTGYSTSVTDGTSTYTSASSILEANKYIIV